MYPLIAALVVVAIVVFMWRYLDSSPRPGRPDPTDRVQPARPQRAQRPKRAVQIAPDDDPEFLSELRRRISRQRSEDASDDK
ncbi:hypothetical protein EK0264_05400 [Epidermidibacterium keratini]|uniref:Uncharacterized protein n=1 Tax=Epidermidibacterium keratini TaxID=1891644 RepID=A0A7L4YLQ7_9ACTN|nr:hypothetical protein [Epidermidibacterium keratini]QHB99768.1 hypothetical protein EK0264_05400 [Epidermidibacterium keratini]